MNKCCGTCYNYNLLDRLESGRPMALCNIEKSYYHRTDICNDNYIPFNDNSKKKLIRRKYTYTKKRKVA
jgi:hypothetical protein